MNDPHLYKVCSWSQNTFKTISSLDYQYQAPTTCRMALFATNFSPGDCSAKFKSNLNSISVKLFGVEPTYMIENKPPTMNLLSMPTLFTDVPIPTFPHHKKAHLLDADIVTVYYCRYLDINPQARQNFEDNNYKKVPIK